MFYSPSDEMEGSSGEYDDDDCDDVELDLSGDEDLADEEVKFGQQMGVNIRARRWTIWRFVRFSCTQKSC